jgi:hypothetical protein
MLLKVPTVVLLKEVMKDKSNLQNNKIHLHIFHLFSVFVDSSFTLGTYNFLSLWYKKNQLNKNSPTIMEKADA